MWTRVILEQGQCCPEPHNKATPLLSRHISTMISAYVNIVMALPRRKSYAAVLALQHWRGYRWGRDFSVKPDHTATQYPGTPYHMLLVGL